MYLKTSLKILFVISALFLPFWFTSLVFIFSTFYFENFYFGIIGMFFVDLLYKQESFMFLNIPGIIFFSSVIVFLLSILVKKFLNINTKSN